MASADLSKELECPICLSIYTDPVNLPCGHNYCRACIDHVLDTQKAGGYSCPECRRKYKGRPTLQRNIALRNIAERFLSTQHQKEVIGVCCTYCFQSPVAAVKSCLHCEASLCDNHLKIHSKAPEHVFCDPTSSLENRKCSVHRKILEYYCTEDAACICVSCSLAGEHRGHQVEILAHASEKKKKKLRNDLKKLRAETEEAEKGVRSLQNSMKKAQEKADGETKRVTGIFRDIRRRLADLEKKVLSEITGQLNQVTLSYENAIQQLEIKKNKLSRKKHQIEELCNMADPLTVLQKSETSDLGDTEVGNKSKEKNDKLLRDGGDLDVARISHTLHTGLADIISGVKIPKRAGAQAPPRSSTEDKAPDAAQQPWPPSRPVWTLQHVHIQDAGPNTEVPPLTLGMPVYADILLDEDTAGYYIHVSGDGKTASRSDSRQQYPTAPERFLVFPQVLSFRTFSSGRHYCDVDVRNSDNWRIGMCYSSIDRKGGLSMIGSNEKSWVLDRGGEHHYTVKHNRQDIMLYSDMPKHKIRIYLHYEAGQISFHALCSDSFRPIHTFAATFTEPLHIVLCVSQGSVTICRENPEV
ncbi:E3 ubiquitin/ISG15 ligase TRIM25-like [Hyperolius riggenbachi]|uniref:E3 ubiquitin/ISG15 ligase TRIM25-like n=1 Tax=Hyperolius riggenbachi TaxID=752182 RepID=UPI0035A34ACE